MVKSEEIGGSVLETYSAAEVKALLDQNDIVLIDVRTPAEYALERIPGALLSPLSTFDPAALPAQGEKRIVLHCGVGARSRKAAELCLASGMDRVAHMEGGLGAWKQARLPLIALDPSTGSERRR